jgi:hypothetical protein
MHTRLEAARAGQGFKLAIYSSSIRSRQGTLRRIMVHCRLDWFSCICASHKSISLCRCCNLKHIFRVRFDLYDLIRSLLPDPGPTDGIHRYPCPGWSRTPMTPRWHRCFYITQVRVKPLMDGPASASRTGREARCSGGPLDTTLLEARWRAVALAPMLHRGTTLDQLLS